jgi:hypothetical protein
VIPFYVLCYALAALGVYYLAKGATALSAISDIVTKLTTDVQALVTENTNLKSQLAAAQANEADTAAAVTNLTTLDGQVEAELNPPAPPAA